MRALNYTVYPIAPPMVFSSAFNNYMAPIMLSVVLGSDVVSRLCMGNAKDIVRACAVWNHLDHTNADFCSSNIIQMHMFLRGQDVPGMIRQYQEIKS